MAIDYLMKRREKEKKKKKSYKKAKEMRVPIRSTDQTKRKLIVHLPLRKKTNQRQRSEITHHIPK